MTRAQGGRHSVRLPQPHGLPLPRDPSPGPLPRGLSAPRAGAGPGLAAREGARSQQSRWRGSASPPSPGRCRCRRTRAARGGGCALAARPSGTPLLRGSGGPGCAAVRKAQVSRGRSLALQGQRCTSSCARPAPPGRPKNRGARRRCPGILGLCAARAPPHSPGSVAW